jgi:hypothetical protein
VDVGAVSLKGRGHLEDLELDERILLKWILETFGGNIWTETMWLIVVPSVILL